VSVLGLYFEVHNLTLMIFTFFLVKKKKIDFIVVGENRKETKQTGQGRKGKISLFFPIKQASLQKLGTFQIRNVADLNISRNWSS
jgi:hypothetical protein